VQPSTCSEPIASLFILNQPISFPMQSAATFVQQRAMSYSKRVLKRARGHPREWPAAVMPVVPPPSFPVAAVQPLASGWAPPLSSSSSLPFQVRAAPPLAPLCPPCLPPAAHARSHSLSAPSPQVSRTSKGNQIPVYTDFKNGRTRELTIVRRVAGDVGELARELYRVTGGAKVEVRPGRVEVAGGRSKEIKSWLAGLGF
jgi:hypothetical protein